jgi:hypothetical protein
MRSVLSVVNVLLLAGVALADDAAKQPVPTTGDVSKDMPPIAVAAIILACIVALALAARMVILKSGPEQSASP